MEVNYDELLNVMKGVCIQTRKERSEAAIKERSCHNKADSEWWSGYCSGLGYAADMLQIAMQKVGNGR